jgi:hypothetical protein
MTIIAWEDPVFEPIRNALVQRMLALGYDEAAAERADRMMRSWDWFIDNSLDDSGHPTYLDWMDPELVRLLDKALRLYYDLRSSTPEDERNVY